MKKLIAIILVATTLLSIASIASAAVSFTLRTCLLYTSIENVEQFSGYDADCYYLVPSWESRPA